MERNLFFDLDGMKFDTLPAQVAYVNQTYGTKITAEEFMGNGNKLDILLQKHTNDATLTRDKVYTNFGKDFIIII